MSEELKPPPPDQGTQAEWDAYLQAQGEGVFNPATKSAKEVPLEEYTSGVRPLDRAAAGELADVQPDTPVESLQRADRVEQVRKTLASINDKDAEVIRRRNTEDPDTGEIETYESIAKDLPRGDGSGEKGVSPSRVQQRERSGKFDIGQQIRRSGSAGHPFKDYRDGIDKY